MNLIRKIFIIARFKKICQENRKRREVEIALWSHDTGEHYKIEVVSG